MLTRRCHSVKTSSLFLLPGLWRAPANFAIPSWWTLQCCAQMTSTDAYPALSHQVVCECARISGTQSGAGGGTAVRCLGAVTTGGAAAETGGSGGRSGAITAAGIAAGSAARTAVAARGSATSAAAGTPAAIATAGPAGTEAVWGPAALTPRCACSL